MSCTKLQFFAPLPNTERGKPVVLGGDPSGKTFTYVNGNSVIVRNIENPLDAYAYTEHSVHATVAKYAPSGFYIASADASGKVRIWDTTNADHILKYEYRPLSGPIKDLVWSPDSKRIAVCGEGRDLFAHAFLWDSGSSVGELTGHSKFVNSIDYRSDRPFRVVTASEDNDVGFYAGPPFKLQQLNHNHSRFANVVRYAPDGHVFVSGGADGKLFVFEGKEGKLVHELNGGAESAHGGQVFAISWSADNKHLISASGDRTVKMWSADDNQLVKTFTFGEDVLDQQVGCLWQGSHLLSVSLSGHINYLDTENPSTPKRVIKGHAKTVNALAVDKAANVAYCGSFTGRISALDLKTGDSRMVTESASSIKALELAGGSLVTVANDDYVRTSPKDGNSLSADGVKVEKAPNALAVHDKLAVAASENLVTLIRNGSKVSELKTAFSGISAAFHPNGKTVAVGSKEGKFHVFNIEGDSLKETGSYEASGSVETLEYSPDGQFLATGDSNRNVFVFDVAGYAKKMDRWKFHTSKVTCLAWAPDSQHIVSGGVDTNLIIWDMKNEAKRITVKSAHPLSPITSVKWVDDATILSAGQDSSVRSWSVKY